MRAIRFHETGGPEKLRFDDLPDPEPAAGQLALRVEAAGVNFIDTYHRRGLYPVPLPRVLGSEVAGSVTAIGPGVKTFKPGDRVVTWRALGGYAEQTLVPADQAVPVPEGIATDVAAATFVQGLTAHCLACDVFPLRPGHAALVHAASGGVGLLLVQIAKQRGARVLATVGNDAKASLARAAGADAVCVYTRENFAAAARAFTEGRGVDVAYDGVGAATFEGTIDSLRPRGMFVSYGNASGAVPPFSPLVLMQKGSLYFTRPTMGDYTATPTELQARAAELFAWIRAGTLRVTIGAVFPLAAAAEAHRALEGRQTTGKILLRP